MKRLTLLIPCLLLLMGCATTENNFTFASGKYTFEVPAVEDGRPVRIGCFIRNRDGDIEIRSSYNGEVICNAILEDGKFIASVSSPPSYVTYRGKLIANNHIKGKTRMVRDTRGRPFPGDKGAPIKHEKFSIYPCHLEQSKEMLEFLPTVKLPNYFFYGGVDPRSISVGIDSDSKLFEFKDPVYDSDGFLLLGFQKQGISRKKILEKLKDARTESGNSVPVDLYAHKNAPFKVIHALADSLAREAGLYRFQVVATHPEWEGLPKFSLPFDLRDFIDGYEEKPIPEKYKVRLKITKSGYSVGGKQIGDIHKFLDKVERGEIGGYLIITYSDNATVQQYINFSAICQGREPEQNFRLGEIGKTTSAP